MRTNLGVCVQQFVFILVYVARRQHMFQSTMFREITVLKRRNEFFTQYHPGTNITFIDDFTRSSSLRPLWIQVPRIRNRMAAIMNDHPDGVHIVCFSQGGLICRGVIETMPAHNVVNFISLSSPQAGQFGDTSYFGHILPGYVKKDLYKLFYTEKGQAWLSIANYWNDPYQQALYLKWSAYLAVINNPNTSNETVPFEKRSNFIRLRNLVLVGGPDDGVITPWQSSHFATYNESEGIITMEEQKWYMDDSFGLRTLQNRGSVHVYSVPGVHHTSWHKDLKVFLDCIEPWIS